MIRSFRHKGLRILYETGSRRGVPAARAERLQEILTLLDVATSSRDLALPGLRLHQLHGALAAAWSVAISGNWRITFVFELGEVFEVDLVEVDETPMFEPLLVNCRVVYIFATKIGI